MFLVNTLRCRHPTDSYYLTGTTPGIELSFIVSSIWLSKMNLMVVALDVMVGLG